MADNIDITPGTGKTVATDEVTIDGAAAHVQRVKPAWGAAGAAVDVSATDPLPSAVRYPRATASGTMSATNATVSVACADMASFTVEVTAGGFTNLTPEVSFDGGTNYRGVPSFVQGQTSTGLAASGTQSMNSSINLMMGAIPAGATHFRVRAGSATSITVTVLVSAAPPSVLASLVHNFSAAGIGATLLTGNAQVGHVRAAGIWLDDTATPLAGAGTFTGTSRDVSRSAGNEWNGFGSTNLGSVEVRGLAVSDVAGTLHLEVSRDNSTWRRIKSTATAAVGGSGLHVAEIEHKPKTRYARWVYVNDAGAQGHFMLQTFLLSA